MSNNTYPTDAGKTPRREFVKKSAGLAAGAALAANLTPARAAHGAGDDAIKIALIGCGGRGTGAAIQALQAMDGKANVKLVAMADAFRDCVDGSLERIKARCRDTARVDVPEERKFSGFDGCEQAIHADVDVVLLCTPPGFRPMQFEAAVTAGKHVFMEKPVAVDAPGIRKVLAANEVAKKKGLAVCVGLNMRHTNGLREVANRVRDGILGRLLYLRCYCNNAGVWVRPREPGQTEMEYQMRNWYYFNWLCGDHIVEQHVHLLDLVNWMKGDHPVEANGMGGRQVRKGKDHGEIYDHHAVEYTYADGTKMFSFCRHIPGCWNHGGGYAHGTEGTADAGGDLSVRLNAKEPMQFERGPDGHQVEHDDLFAALRAGEPFNEGDYGATSTMTAILGRMATYSGKVVTWDEAIGSQIDLSPERYAWDADPPILPDQNGFYACAIPGVTKAT
ncbi:MAG TPA: Gfo/Idh/MocA family oxidoreductase [Thermoguttaceae bacterium]|nr:Gfo/Idh/MocA family oxidoreductase [Thermoguttaceae bacterium]